MTTTNCQPPDCPCFCPSAALPLAPILVPEGGPGTVFQLPIFGTQPFQVSIILNPLLPIAQVPLIASVQMIAGNTLIITTGIPDASETLGNYLAQLRVCNPCGELIIDVPVEVVADLTPVVSDCTLAQGVWTFENRIPALGDTMLAFTPAGCRALLPPSGLDVCNVLQGFPTVVPQPVDTVIGVQGGVCSQFTVAELVNPTNLCSAIAALPVAGPLSPLDEFVVRQFAGCGRTTLQQISLGFDICAALQNLPNAVVQPTAAFYGQQGGNCFEFLVSDLLGGPFLAADGSCAAPSYSFTNAPDHGMFFTGSALRVSADNCGDYLELGASINLIGRSLVGVGSNITIDAGDSLTTGDGGATLLLFGGQVSNGGNIRAVGGESDATPGYVWLQGGTRDPAGSFGGPQFGAGIRADAGASNGGDVDIAGGGGASLRGDVVIWGQFNPGVIPFWTVERLRFHGQTGEWRIASNAGAAGEVITSQGVGLPPVWAPGGSSFPLLAPDGSCAAPSYSFTNSPDSGMFYTGTAVRIGDDNCTDFIEIGASINITTGVVGGASGNITINSATATSPGSISLQPGGTSSATGFGGSITGIGGTAPAGASGAGGAVSFASGAKGANSGATFSLGGAGAAVGGAVTLASGNDATISFLTSAALRFTITTQMLAELVLSSVNPQYSFTARETAGMRFQSGTGGGQLVVKSADAGFSGITQGRALSLFGGDGDTAILNSNGGQALLRGGNTSSVGGVGGTTLIQGGLALTDVDSGAVAVRTGSGATLRLEIIGTGDWELAGNPGVAGEHITSQGAGLPPVWAAAVVFPLLAPDGTCLAPSYSFASSPDSGMFYDSAGVGSVVIGDDNCADFISIGASVNIFTATTFAVSLGGVTATASGTNSFAIGSGADALAAESIALGSDAITHLSATGSIAIGDGANTNNAAAVAAVAIGGAAVATGARSVAIGFTTAAPGTGAIAIGDGAATGGGGTPAPGAIAVGDAALVSTNADNSIAIGPGASVGLDALRAVAIGFLAVADDTGVIAIGDAANGGDSGSIAIGDGANAGGNDSITIGAASVAAGSAVAVGRGATASGASSICIGPSAGATAAGTNSIAIGEESDVASAQCVVVGSDATIGTTSDGAIAIGKAATVNAGSADGIAIGRTSAVSAINAIAIGLAVTNAVTNTAKIGTSNTNFFNLNALGQFSLAGTAAMFLAPSYTVATLPTGVFGGVISVSDSTPAPTLAFFDGTNWIDLITGVVVV